MTPQQKLVYIKSLASAIRAQADIANDFNQHGGARHAAGERAQQLRLELDAVLSDVHLPPAELINVPDPETWAQHMARTLPGLSEETALAWLDKAMYTARLQGLCEGRVEAAKDIDQRLTDGRQSLADAIRLVLNLQQRQVLKPQMVRDPNDPDNPPVTLREYLESVLRSAGEDV